MNAWGGADVKILAGVGAMIGVAYTPIFFIVLGVVGVFYTLIYQIAVNKKEIPFIPAFLIAYIVGVSCVGASAW